MIDSLQEFAKRFKARNEALTTVSNGSENAEVAKVIELLKMKRIKRENLGREAQALPRLIARDERLYHFAQTAKVLEAEAKAADLVYARSLAFTDCRATSIPSVRRL